MSAGKLIIISAPSGTGKTTICKQLLKNNPKWKFSISATTRNLRTGEIDGRDYQYMPKEKFEHAVKFGDFLEWEWVHGNKNGTLISPIENALDDGIYVNYHQNYLKQLTYYLIFLSLPQEKCLYLGILYTKAFSIPHIILGYLVLLHFAVN